MAMHLAGVRPVWDEGSDRVTGYEILPLALMDRPRIEVTLRVSGLFRDVFSDLARLFEAATTALAQRDEAWLVDGFGLDAGDRFVEPMGRSARIRRWGKGCEGLMLHAPDCRSPPQPLTHQVSAARWGGGRRY